MAGLLERARLLGRRFRRQRLETLRDDLGIGRDSCVVDVGGRPAYWALLPRQLRPKVMMVNLTTEECLDQADDVTIGVVASGLALPFRDRCVDVVHANSVIEHVPAGVDQERFVDEMTRVGRQRYLQTPNRWFPIEPHFMMAIFHWLPKRAQWPFVRFASLDGLTKRYDSGTAREESERIWLLSRRQLECLVPGARIAREKSIGLTKSFLCRW